MRISGSAILWPWLCVFAVFSSCLCFSQDAQQSKATTQALSQNIHETLADLKAQQEALSSALAEARTALRLSQEQVSELRTELRDLNISSRSMSEKLTDCTRKLNACESKWKGWRKAALIGWGLIVLYVLLKILKVAKHIPVPFI